MDIGKNNRWHSKNKPSRGQLYYQQQQPFSCNPKPVVLLDQPSSTIAPIPSSATSFLVASSTFAHAGPLSREHYNNKSGVTHLLPQSFNFKPSNVQTFCLIQDRQNAQQHQQHPMQASYYNISATNTCSLQTVNANSSFPLPSSLNPYTNLATFNTNQFPTMVQSSPLFTNPPVGLILAPTRKDNKSLPALNLPPFKHNASKTPSSICESRVVPVSHSDNFNSWPPQIETSIKNSCDAHTASNNKSLESADRTSQKPISAKTDEEHYSDESSISFDFTIEAEKMVSALCNTTSSNDLGKEESKLDNKTDSAPLFSGAGDNVSNKANWFTDFCSEYENGTSIGVQTDAYPCTDRSQYPELIRKTAYWGCTEAEIVLGSNNSQTDDSKQSWLTYLSSATRTAITKSSTCIPVFAGDRVLANDLINALLRISNGWLSLDNYLNKQHFPNLFDRLEPELIACFHTWEESTYELLKQIVRTFQKFGENNEVTNQKYNTICESSSFPGDVSLYMNYNLFAQPSSRSFIQQNTVRKASSRENPSSVMSTPLSTNSLHNFQYNSDQQEQQSAAQKESKLRSKWTITENLSSVINSTKSMSNVHHTTDIGGLANTKLRTKNVSSASRKFESTQKSLNAEFCQLRNKVMESSADMTKDRRHDFRSENKFSPSHNNTDQSIKVQHLTMNTPPLTYSGLYAQNCLSFTFPLSNHPSSSSYPASNPGISTYSGHASSSGCSYPITDINSKNNRDSEPNYGTKSANVHPTYVGRPQIDQTEFPVVPRNKMTLLSQIEPRTFDKESKEMAANLSAWFASMRNAQPPATTSTFEESRMNENSGSRLFAQQEMPKYSMSGSKQSQIDANRQFQALQNLPNIQSTPWAAANFVNRHQTTQHAPEEYDSSEDVRVYMKPGSYNVPRKRHQKRSNRRLDNSNATSSRYNNVCGNKGKSISILASSTPLSHTNAPTISNSTLIKTSFPPASQLPIPLFDLENSPRILKRTESLSQDAHQDITWKAACASAEILLEALNVKDCGNACKKIDCNDNTEEDDKNKNDETSQQDELKLLKHNNVDYASSYEASEDDSGSTCKLSPSTSVLSASQLREEENGKDVAIYYSYSRVY